MEPQIGRPTNRFVPTGRYRTILALLVGRIDQAGIAVFPTGRPGRRGRSFGFRRRLALAVPYLHLLPGGLLPALCLLFQPLEHSTSVQKDTGGEEEEENHTVSKNALLKFTADFHIISFNFSYGVKPHQLRCRTVEGGLGPL